MKGNFLEWDNKLTTPPSMYIVYLPFFKILEKIFNMDNIYVKRIMNV